MEKIITAISGLLPLAALAKVQPLFGCMADAPHASFTMLLSIIAQSNNENGD
jgi:hypothetical protein